MTLANSDNQKNEITKNIKKQAAFVKKVIDEGKGENPKVFDDKEFPAKFSSIFDPAVDSAIIDDGSKFESLIWKRCSEVFTNPTVFGKNDSVSQEDIQQGYLGNCYFMTVLSSMVRVNPDSIVSLFETKHCNEAGVYMINLFVNGMPTPVIVDDKIPVWPYNNEPAFAKSKNGCLWVILLEKAWAKLHGSYCRMDS